MILSFLTSQRLPSLNVNKTPLRRISSSMMEEIALEEKFFNIKSLFFLLVGLMGITSSSNWLILLKPPSNPKSVGLEYIFLTIYSKISLFSERYKNPTKINFAIIKKTYTLSNQLLNNLSQLEVLVSQSVLIRSG